MKVFIVAVLLAASCSALPYGAVSSQYHTQDTLGQYAYGYADPNSQKHESRSADGTTHGGYSYVDGHGHVQSVKYSADPIHGFQVAGTNLPKAHPVLLAHAAPVAYAHHVAPVSHSYIAHSAPWAGHLIAAHGVPHDTPEVAAAKIAHFAAHAEERAKHYHHKRSVSAWGNHAYSAPWSHGAVAAPVIHNGVPVDTPEVQHAKAAHFAAHAAASHGAVGPSHYAPAPVHHQAHYAPAAHYGPAPVIHNGVPVDTPEVQHAKAAHFAAVAKAQSQSHSHGGAPSHYAPAHHGHSGSYHVPVIHNGVPVETPEVQHAKAAHFAAVAEAQQHSGGHHHEQHGSWSDDDGSWKHDGHSSQW